MALNLLGLSTQVPARAIYLSDGPDRAYKLGNTSLVFENTALKEGWIQAAAKRPDCSGTQVIGFRTHHARGISKIRAWLPESLRKKVLADTKTATGWVYAAIQQITQEEPHV